MMEKILLLGSGGHAKSVADAILQEGSFEIAGFVDNACKESFAYRGYTIIGSDEDLEVLFKSGIRNAFVCVGYLGRGRVRNRLYGLLKNIGFTLPVIMDSSAVLASDAQVGEGTFIGKGAIVNANAVIGKMAILNTASVVEHDCRIGDFSHVAVAGVVCGGAQIGENTLIGANATLLQNISIGDNVIIGAGSVVTKNVEHNSLVIGNKVRNQMEE